jgi:hypothetical protein
VPPVAKPGSAASSFLPTFPPGRSDLIASRIAPGAPLIPSTMNETTLPPNPLNQSSRPLAPDFTLSQFFAISTTASPNGPVRMPSSSGQFFLTQPNVALIAPHTALTALRNQPNFLYATMIAATTATTAIGINRNAALKLSAAIAAAICATLYAIHAVVSTAITGMTISV